MTRGKRQRRPHPRLAADLLPLAGNPAGLARRLAFHPATPSSRLARLIRRRTGAHPFRAARSPAGQPLARHAARSLIDADLCEVQPAEPTIAWPNPAIFPGYLEELQRRDALQGYPVTLDSTGRNCQPYFLCKLPPSEECGRAPQAN